MRVRAFEIEDVAWAAPLADEVFAALDRDYGAAIAKWGADPMVVGWVAEASAVPAGFLLAGSFGLVGDDRPHVLEILAIGVRPELRRLGVGRSLLARVLQEGRARSGVREVRLTVAADNAGANALFAQAGFELDRADDGTFPGGQRALRLVWRPRRNPPIR